MQLAAKYNPAEVEDKWYAYWLKHRFFHSEPDRREPYTIVIPPPNVTGVLHMGHMLNTTIQDVLVRRARMQGKNACWVPGTDHASIATEAKVVAKLKEAGVNKAGLTREQFLTHAWEWKEKHGGIILEQLKKLGASCDWERTRFTMEPALSDAVTKAFVHFYNKGWIYRGVRMVNWDPVGKTAVSDEEVIHKEQQGKLYYIRYYISDGSGAYLTIATTRPETIMADTAVAINPNDERHKHLHGKKALIPLINKEIPVILDDYVATDFGTGCLKVTPAHDVNDYEIGLRHKLPVIDILDDDGKLNEKAQLLVGEDRFAARGKIAKMLADAGHLEKTEDYKNQVGFSERTNAVIEPRLSLQWFLKMKEMAKPALQYVMNDEIKLIPDKFRNTYRHWMENVCDWCISRQLWWGQRIPAWYLPGGEFVVAGNEDEALQAAQKVNPALKKTDLRQDEDVVDTWFSSWLWPVSVFDPQAIGNPGHTPNADLHYYYPTNDLITAPEILFFWVARMIMAGHEFTGKAPFRNVYLTGIVRDKQGRKMSKSLGNSPDPLKLIAHYGADGVRMGMLLTSPAGNDLPFDESLCEQGRNFCNKIWNAFRLIKGWQAGAHTTQPPHAAQAVKWFDNALNKTITEINDDFEKYRLSEALMKIYKLFWDDFCAWYLEIIKPQAGQAIDETTLSATLSFFDKLLHILHPFMPFISEELWQQLAARNDGESLMVQLQPPANGFDEAHLSSFEMTRNAITAIRTIRQNKNIPLKEPLELYVKGAFEDDLFPLLQKMTNLKAVYHQEQQDTQNGASFLLGTTDFFIPLGDLINTGEELKKLRDDLAYQQKFVAAITQKLSNGKFVQNAPAQVVALERKKQADGEARIKAIEEQINSLTRK
ncbi:MAG: valine--tRNA ligase [Prevotellaceae bacterium]|jgi:valyl-tRNA synthetase|nr:valine--tRNA ligase [Prevotellaceae bacterium]